MCISYKDYYCLAFVALNLVWLFPVMNNSKKDEPPIEKLSCFLPNKNNLNKKKIKVFRFIRNRLRFQR